MAYEWRACTTVDGSCRTASDSTATPFAAARYVVGHRDVGRHLRLIETATEVVETDPATFRFRVVRVSRRVTSPQIVGAYARGRAPRLEFLNGLPEKTTGSNAENFQVTLPHFNTADGKPVMQYRVDDGAWRAVRTTRVFGTGELSVGDHRVSIRAQNRAGATTRTYGWRVVPLPAPAACVARESQPCWYPPHLDSTGQPMRWDWQIGRVTPLQRTGADAVDIYDIDGFLTTPAEIDNIHTAWQASTLAHPERRLLPRPGVGELPPDGARRPRRRFPGSTLGKVYYGYPNERWVDFRQLNALKPMLDARIAMCAAKGFDSVELDDIDSFDPPSTTGFG